MVTENTRSIVRKLIIKGKLSFLPRDRGTREFSQLIARALGLSPAQYTGTLQSNTKMADVDDRGSAGDEEGGKDLWY